MREFAGQHGADDTHRSVMGVTMQTAHEFFIHELKDMLDAEQQLVEALGKQAEESTRPELRKAFESHRAQTEKQAQRLEQVFESIGETPEHEECAGIRGLIEEHENFKKEDPSGALLDIFNVGAATKVERYEISSYESLVRLAREMGHRKAAQLLTQNLKEEQQTLKKMEGFSKKLKPERTGMGEVEEQSQTQRKSRSGRSRRAA
jgi:ferritin-like metal-binding protein YciE